MFINVGVHNECGSVSSDLISSMCGLHYVISISPIYIYFFFFQSNLKQDLLHPITMNMNELKKLGGKVLQSNLQAKTYARGSSHTWHNVARKKRTINDHFNFPCCVSKQEGKGSFTDAFVLACSDLQLLSKGIALLATATGPCFGLSVFSLTHLCQFLAQCLENNPKPQCEPGCATSHCIRNVFRKV